MKEKGRITFIGEKETFAKKDGSGQTFVIQKFRIDSGFQYANEIEFTILGEKVNLAPFKVGDFVEVSFNLKSIESSDGRWFHNVSAWKVELFNRNGGRNELSQAQLVAIENAKKLYQQEAMNVSQQTPVQTTPPPQDDDLPF